MNADATPQSKPGEQESPPPAAPERANDAQLESNAEMAVQEESAHDDATAKKTRRRRWPRRLLITLVVLVGLYTLFGFVGVPLLIKHVGLSRAQQRLNGVATLGSARFNPYTFDLVLRNFEVVDAAGERVLAFERFDGNFQLWPTLFQSGYHFLEAVVTAPYVDAEISEEGTFNFAGLIKPAPEPSPQSEPIKRIPRVVVRHMGLVDADIAFRDLSAPEPFEAALDHFTFQLDGLDTQPASVNPLRLVATTEAGGRLSWEGTFNLDPLSSRGSLAIDNLDLPRFVPYTLRYTQARLNEGRLWLSLEYDFAPLASPRVASATVHELRLESLKATHDAHGLVEIEQVLLTGVQADADARALSVESIAVRQPNLHLLRDSSGKMELLVVVNQPAVEEVVDEITRFGEHRLEERIDPRTIEYPIPKIVEGLKQLAEDALGGWQLAVTEVAVEDAAGSWGDESAREPVNIGFSDLSLRAGPIRSREDFEVPFELTGTLAEQGRIATRGTAGLLSRQYTAEIDLQSLPLAPVSGYLPREFAADLPPAALRQATLRLVGTASAAMTDAGDVEGDWQGEIALESVEVTNADSQQRLIRLGLLQVQGTAGAERSATGALSLDWDGTTTLRDLTGSAPLAGSIDLTLGDLSTTGRLSVVSGADSPLQFTYGGELRTHDAAVSLPELAAARAGYAGVALSGINFDAASGTLHIAQAQVEQPKFSGKARIMPSQPVEIESADENGSASADAPQVAEQPSTSRPFVALPIPYTVLVDKASISGGTVELRDEEAERPVTVIAEDIAVEVESLTTDGSSNLKLQVNSKLQNSGRVVLTGEVNPFAPDLYADVQLDVSTLPLKPYDPFSAYYIGYLIDRGSLTLSLPIQVQGGAVDGTLNANLDTFYLADKVESPTAPDLPIKLGLDLLRNRSEQIDVSVGIQGNLNDPSFSFAHLIMQAFLNTLGKAALAPFDLLASAFAQDGEIDDLSMLVFAPGSAEIEGEAVRKLDVLARALADRPGLRLTIIGKFNAAQDAEALRRVLLDERLLERVRESNPAARSLSDAQREKALAALFEERYPDRVSDPVPIPPGKLNQQTLSSETMEQALMEAINVPDERYLALAQTRARAVQDRLVAEGAIEPTRLTLAEPATAEQAQADQPLVEFDLE